jgi:hypothetical protein
MEQLMLDSISHVCPFCSDEYLFDFTMKEHLKKHHTDEIARLDSWPVEQFLCPYCKATFYYSSLIPKHINFSHGKAKLDNWLDNTENYQKYQIDKANEKFLDRSPGLSDLFNELDTCDSIKKFKLTGSILKKTPYSGKIVILSPETAVLRRTIHDLRRLEGSGARKKLRFDVPCTSPEIGQEASPKALTLQTPKKSTWNFFKTRKSPTPVNTKMKKKIRTKACKMSNRSANQILTSTPMNRWNDSSDDIQEDLDNSIGSNWKTALKTSTFQSMLLSSERFQCNFCDVKFDCNASLLCHKKNNHKRISFLPSFKCGQCGSKFYRNCQLVRHCNNQH